MPALQIVDSFRENLAEGVHDFGNAGTIALALTNTAPTAASTLLAGITQISYTNLTQSSEANRTLTSITSTYTGGTYTLDAADFTFNATGTVATFRYVVLYDPATAVLVDPIIGWYDYGTGLTLASGESLTITFAGTGILTIT